MHILPGKSKSIDISTSREGGEREMCVLFEFRHFFLSTYFKVSCIYLQKILIDEMYYIINGICADGEQAKAFWLTKVKRFIGSPRLIKWTCTNC